MEIGWYIEGIVLATIQRLESEESGMDMLGGLLLAHGTPEPYIFGEFDPVVPNPDDLIVVARDTQSENFYVGHVQQTHIKPPAYTGQFKHVNHDNYWMEFFNGGDVAFFQDVQHVMSQLYEIFAKRTGIEPDFRSEAKYNLSFNMRTSKMPKRSFEIWKPVNGLEEALERYDNTIGPQYYGDVAPLD